AASKPPGGRSFSLVALAGTQYYRRPGGVNRLASRLLRLAGRRFDRQQVHAPTLLAMSDNGRTCRLVGGAQMFFILAIGQRPVLAVELQLPSIEQFIARSGTGSHQ